jgi:hypothetical protein
MLHFTENRPIEFLRACLSKASKYLSGRSYTPFLVLADAYFSHALGQGQAEDRAYQSCPKLCLYSSAAESIATLRKK